jgi:hypothetical protein
LLDETEAQLRAEAARLDAELASLSALAQSAPLPTEGPVAKQIMERRMEAARRAAHYEDLTAAPVQPPKRKKFLGIF